MKKFLLHICIIAGVLFGWAGVATAHDITNPSGVCVGTTAKAADFTFTASNMGNETRHIDVLLNGSIVGGTGDFQGNGTKTVHVTNLALAQTGNTNFTWTTDANVPQGTPTAILVDFSSCQPPCTGEICPPCSEEDDRDVCQPPCEETECPVPPCGEDGRECPTTTTPTTIPPFCKPDPQFPNLVCLNIEPTTTTTTIPPTTTTTTVVTTSSSIAATPTEPTSTVAPPAPAPTVVPEKELPHTGNNTLPGIIMGLGLITFGASGLVISRRKA